MRVGERQPVFCSVGKRRRRAIPAITLTFDKVSDTDGMLETSPRSSGQCRGAGRNGVHVTIPVNPVCELRKLLLQIDDLVQPRTKQIVRTGRLMILRPLRSL
jgi:hypothetical protein